ncbi:MAG: DinB family protein [Trueperaceae bacterium]|nr:DinB family protein [Trueperaceae bacterium]
MAERLKQYLPHEHLMRYGDTVDAVEKSATKAVADFLSLLEALPDAVRAAPVAPGKWSPDGFGDHLVKVTEIYLADVRRVAAGGEASRHEPGIMDDRGNMVVTVEGAQPDPGRDPALLGKDLRRATAELVSFVREAEAAGLGSTVVHVNPYFGELTPLKCLQLAAAHAVYHRKKHLESLVA